MSMRDQCPACAYRGSEHAFDKDGYQVYRCKKCASLFVHNVPSAEELAKIYASNTYYELPQESVKRIDDENIRRVKSVTRHLKSGEFLDIGCARGGLLDIAKKSGFETFGVEPTPANAEVASSKGHVVFNGFLNEFAHEEPSKRFDVITCLDVIEHIEFPLEFMKTIVSLLSETGVLVLSTPNYSGIVAKKLKDNDPYMTPPEHLNFFTSNGLRKLCQSCGLIEVGYTNFGSLTTAETERSISRFLPWLGKPLYPLVKSTVNISFSLANKFNVGLEQEIYLRISK